MKKYMVVGEVGRTFWNNRKNAFGIARQERYAEIFYADENGLHLIAIVRNGRLSKI